MPDGPPCTKTSVVYTRQVPVSEMVEDPLGVQKQLAEDDQVFNAMAGVSRCW